MLQRERERGGKRRPKMFPVDNLEASNYWRQLMEPPNEHTEAIDWVHTKSGGHWHAPYIDRMVYTLKRFMAMTHVEQVFIIDGIENKNCPWRGDSIDMYKMILEEEQKMRLDPGPYKEKAFSVLKGFRSRQEVN